MRKIEKENGDTIFVFEDHEAEQKKRFERGLMADDALDLAFGKLIETITDAKILASKAWVGVEEIIEREHGIEAGTQPFSYNWRTGVIKFADEKE